MHVFNVQDTHDVRVVSLYPKENVAVQQGVAIAMCYHIGSKAQLGCTGKRII